MTVRKKLLLTTVVLLVCAVVFLFAPGVFSRLPPAECSPETAMSSSSSKIVRTTRTSPGAGSVTGVVYEVMENGLLVRSGERPIPPLVHDEKTAEETAEVEWADVVTSLEQPVSGPQEKNLQSRFRRALGRLPRSRRAEALQAAMNLIPDENSAVVVGLVFDLSQPEEIVNLAFSDVLNRSDAVKNDVVRRVACNPNHPNYVDARRMDDILRLGTK